MAKYQGSDIKPLTDKERKSISREALKVADEKHQAGFGAGNKGSK